MEIVNTPSLTSASDLSALFIAFDMRLQEAFNKVSSIYEKFTTTIPTSTEVAKLPWLQLFPQMRQWTGDRVLTNYVLQDILVINKKFELTASISRTAIEDDQYGAFLAMAPARIAREVKILPDREVSAAIEANAATFDGVAFFNASHPIDPTNPASAVQSNLLSGLSATNYPGGLSPDNLQAARALHRSRKGPDGAPLGLMPNALMVPPALELVARVAASASIYPQGIAAGAAPVSNVYQGEYEVIVNPYLTDATAWYLLSTNESVMPFMWSERTPPEYTSITDPQNPLVFMKDEYLIGARRRGAAFNGLYYLATKGTST